MDDLFKNSLFKLTTNPFDSFEIPFIQTSEIDLVPRKELVLTEDSQKILEQDYDLISKSVLRRDGAVVIFGTFDSLHAGHLNMLRTAKHLGDELYIGIENLEKALIRKQGKHEIQSAYDRKRNIQKTGITTEEKVFVRESALSDIQKLISSGVKITTLAVGESQCDNPEIVEAVRWCLDNDIQVVAINRLKVRGGVAEISSSAIRKNEGLKNEIILYKK